MLCRRGVRSVVAVLAVARLAGATDAGAAQVDFEQGRRLAQRGDCRSAIPVFERSYENQQRTDTLIELARCPEQLGDRDTAAVYYRTLVDKIDDPEAARVAREALDRLAGKPMARRSSTSPAASPTDRHAPREGWTSKASAGVALVIPQGFFDGIVTSGKGVSARGGATRWRRGAALSPGLRFDYVEWSLAGAYKDEVITTRTDAFGRTFHIGADLRIASAGRSAQPFFSLGIGADLNRWANSSTDNLAMNLGAGSDWRVGNRGALGFAILYHPAMGAAGHGNGFYNIKIHYVALLISAGIY